MSPIHRYLDSNLKILIIFSLEAIERADMSRLPKIGTAGRGSRHQMYEWIKALHVIAVIA